MKNSILAITNIWKSDKVYLIYFNRWAYGILLWEIFTIGAWHLFLLIVISESMYFCAKLIKS